MASAILERAEAAPSCPAAPDLHREKAVVAAEKVVSWDWPQGVGAGLQNTGNSCYLNAALQCLTHMPPLANYLLSREHSLNCSLQGGCTMCAMEAHVTQCLLHSREVLQPSEKLTAAFHKHKQEDAHEFLLFTLNAMQESCLRGSKHCEATPSEDSTPIREIFGGSWRSRIKCLHCQGTSDSVSPFLDIVLDIKAAESVKQALEDLGKAEELCGENAYSCGRCQAKRLAAKTLTVEGAPKVLLLLLNRFSDITGAKVDRQVSYPESLDLQPYLSQPNRGPLPYALCAVLVHAGVTCLSGHYFCYVRSGDGQWYKMDDSKVTRCEVTSVLTEAAYVLFYVQEAHLSKDRIGGQVGKGQEAQVLERGPKKKLHGGSWAKAQEPHRDLEHRAIREISLDQWKGLQEDSHPNLPMKLRRVEPALPADAVVIHQARHGGDWPRNGPHKENYPCPNPVGFLPAHGARSTGELCSHGETSRPGTKKKKRKNKPVWRPLTIY